MTSRENKKWKRHTRTHARTIVRMKTLRGDGEGRSRDHTPRRPSRRLRAVCRPGAVGVSLSSCFIYLFIFFPRYAPAVILPHDDDDDGTRAVPRRAASAARAARTLSGDNSSEIIINRSISHVARTACPGEDERKCTRPRKTARGERTLSAAGCTDSPLFRAARRRRRRRACSSPIPSASLRRPAFDWSRLGVPRSSRFNARGHGRFDDRRRIRRGPYDPDGGGARSATRRYPYD